MHKLLILDTDARQYKTLIEQRMIGRLAIATAADATSARHFLEMSDIILGRPDLVAQILDHAPRLRWVQSTFAGVDALMAPDLPTGYLLTGIKGVFGPLMSEYVLAQIVNRERNLIDAYTLQRQHVWQQQPYRGLSGLTIGIVGLGSIGRHVAKTAHHFGMRVLGMKRSPASVDHVERIFLPHQGPEFLPQVDYLVLILPATTATHHFIARKELELMKRNAVLINVGRGCTVAQDDLTTALRERIINGAILDVFEEEPLSSDSPLWDLPNVTITPHQAAFSFPEQIATIFCRNYKLFCKGRPLQHQIDFARGY
ncbi:D-2-hydroxyacid dehydrogenase [Desulfofustis limnaeus]|jgi:phosphoglycerate dehydrogenase-like enzyme|uniref:2-hydroxyacid dehydrogenase n=1 Tax=Desulfofustis limnaeus TaxID=2740163 RepID=A0ABN6MD28_9BACT|nr:D-2-hydroxyacid dehydrogenase [Desulfofustis limnaeus]MDX9896690.1 D-2-hydroxyacid dehydrogenase [Desulfofustis sp.]BDD89402.1 2-hydroxyacid dehydrogenase [Desulfofustis limnaeus]